MVTPPDEIDRINERLRRERVIPIGDRDSYDLAFENLIMVPEKSMSDKQITLRNSGWRKFRAEHPEVAPGRTFEKTKPKEFRKVKRAVREGISFERRFSVPTILRGRVVKSEKTSVVVKGKRIVRHREPRGRFTSPKVPKGK